MERREDLIANMVSRGHFVLSVEVHKYVAMEGVGTFVEIAVDGEVANISTIETSARYVSQISTRDTSRDKDCQIGRGDKRRRWKEKESKEDVVLKSGRKKRKKS